ncbi:bifunctional 4-hydroxy-2-oxoglutarate aldolase/2-dehydro-3-deoxy-phosphogluconate aldolase [Bowmanella sp. JS7-9]|uniref:2-dehydro-3-deoxy-phosphogluconate aldolase n=1 Tax=Pseudobowmanella zhangzhouensis TaxID=1537679 RepID=A0ABW1XJ63_9ALTE|nr:bifunctional 4-hydroxy-2-oxoglutarate aldolase/2-dehydro-3-deoxy-phosphogluconate aldolase [Bowmanella sp. JS7-9]TBX27333.1 keto-deoxy-phosphogluconate aldolase [Bowmanella sp. JS7-9]
MSSNWKTSAADIFAKGPVVPVIVLNDLAHAVPLAKALMAGGISVLEVTLRTPVAMDAIRKIAEEVPGACIGAGTVTTAQQLADVTAAGAQFAISPGLTSSLLDAGNAGSIPLIPGISSISELMMGLDKGYDHFKFFPAEAVGGVGALKSIGGPFPQVTFCPTGGIGPNNYRDYLALPNIRCVGGSWVAPEKAMQAGDWAQITELARTAVEGAR